MIAYDLRCLEGHVFEAWFKDRRSFLDQKEAGRVQCPVCGSSGVEVAFTGCAIQTERRRELPEARDSLVHHFQLFLQKNFEDVGAMFAEEARRIHNGQAKRRNIRGTTTPEEEKDLKEDGVEFVKIPIPRLDA